MEAPVLDTTPHPVAPETWLIPKLFPADDGLFIPVSSIVIRGAVPVIVDTSAPLYREHWREQVFSIVDPEDVRWIFLSHHDGDHTGGLLDALEMCPQAILVANFFMVERLALEKPPLPLERMRWIDPGGSFDAGDRTLHLFKPPVFDGPTTRGLYDSRTSAMWIVDSFPSLTPGPLNDVRELPGDLVEESMRAMSSMVSPWHQWLDPTAYRHHVNGVESLGAAAVASAHGPIITGGAIHEAFDRVRRLAGEPIIPPPGQELLDTLITQGLAGTPA